MPAHRRSRLGRYILFASGDFAFNLYWQTISLYLLFYYIDVFRIPPVVAGTIFMIGALWDGIADLAVGAFVGRTRTSYRILVGWGAVPLGLAFVAMFTVPMQGAGAVLAVQMVFRTLYALTNIPYSAWTTRLSEDAAVRTMLTGLRMMFGAVAAATVALGLPALAELGGYPMAVTVLALVAIPLLVIVALKVPEPDRAPLAVRPPLRGQFGALLRNRAFVTLNIAAGAGGGAAALLMQSVPYYFRYVTGHAVGGPQALAAMGVAGTIALPAWTMLATRVGARRAWLIAALIGLLGLAAHGWSNSSGWVWLGIVSIAFAGFNLSAWSLLPDTVDWGETQGDVRVEALTFGAFAFVQKVVLALIGLTIGVVYGTSGFVAGTVQTPATTATIHWLMLGGPAGLIAVSIAAMIAHPLHRSTLATLRRNRLKSE